MKLLVVFGLIAFAAAAPQQRDQYQTHSSQDAQLVNFDSDNDGFGNYRFAFAQTDGTSRNEQGELKNAGTDDESISVTGTYIWVGPDGVTYKVTYVADDNGFQPTIEQGPGGGVPPAVVASLLG